MYWLLLTMALAPAQADHLQRWQTEGVDQKHLSKKERLDTWGDVRLSEEIGRNRLTIIGSDEEQKRVLDDLRRDPQLVPLANDCVVRAYRPDHWHVAQVGFVITGHPTIYLQAPNGKVLHRQDDYTGPEPLVEALRRANPKYDPEKDINLTRLPIVRGFSNPLIIVGMIVAYLFWRRL